MRLPRSEPEPLTEMTADAGEHGFATPTEPIDAMRTFFSVRP
jgi:hypothetical protein